MAKCEKLFRAQTEVTTHMAVCDPRQRGAAVACRWRGYTEPKVFGWCAEMENYPAIDGCTTKSTSHVCLFVCLFFVLCAGKDLANSTPGSTQVRGQRQRVGKNCLEIFVLSARAKHPGRKHRLFLFLPCAKEFCYRGCVGFLCVFFSNG